MTPEIEAAVASLQTALNAEQVRIEITTAYPVGDLPSTSAAQVHCRTPGGHWRKTGPVVFANQGASRADLLDAFVGLSKGEVR